MKSHYLNRVRLDAFALPLRRVLVSVGLAVFGIDHALAQHAYPTAAAAADAFVDAVKRNDVAAMEIVLGADWRKFVPEGSVDREDVDAFLAEWEKKHRIENTADNVAALIVGDQGWSLPVPIMKSAAGWQFDVKTGADEMKTRRIGRNELATMQAALAYFDAQKDYARADRNGDGVLQYAQQFASSPGKHDGLYWPTADDEPESPLGPLYVGGKPGEGYHGYRYKILKAQGKHAPGGAYDYTIKGRMVSGFALLAWPLRYDDSGVMSFMISHDGQLYQKDLGSDAAAQAVTQFDPDASWSKTSPPAMVDAK